ncbi:MAG: DUF3144 domain-containing protein [Rhodospirillales bacterium]|nr:DUF3144 domain-containing protein [Rhodospirillales bacterium]
MPHDHDEPHTTPDTAGEESNHEMGLGIANELIGFANSKLEQGIDPVAVADGMCHAAANFTAFAAIHAGEGFLTPEQVAQEFNGMLSYYAERHNVEQKPMTGLEKLVETVKNE